MMKAESILEKDEFKQIWAIFYCGEYFKKYTNLIEPYFIDDVIKFGINSENQHYHVPYLYHLGVILPTEVVDD